MSKQPKKAETSQLSPTHSPQHKKSVGKSIVSAVRKNLLFIAGIIFLAWSWKLQNIDVDSLKTKLQIAQDDLATFYRIKSDVRDEEVTGIDFYYQKNTVKDTAYLKHIDSNILNCISNLNYCQITFARIINTIRGNRKDAFQHKIDSTFSSDSGRAAELHRKKDIASILGYIEKRNGYFSVLMSGAESDAVDRILNYKEEIESLSNTIIKYIIIGTVFINLWKIIESFKQERKG